MSVKQVSEWECEWECECECACEVKPTQVK